MKRGKPNAGTRTAGRRPKGRAAVWAAIRRQQTFTVKSVEREADMSYDGISKYFRALERAGFIGRCPTSDQMSPQMWMLIKDCGVQYPRLHQDGRPITTGQGQENMWRTMKILGRFTIHDLVAAASTEDSPIEFTTAQKYVEALARAEYLVRSRRSTRAQKAVYTLAPSKYTGPNPPVIQTTRAVYDPNLDRVVWTAVGGVAQ